MRFYKRISFSIWLYFSIALSLVFAATAFYYSNTQREIITDSRGRELKEFCRTIAIGVEISLDLQNFNKLRKAVDNFYESGRDFDFLLLTQRSEGENESIFTFVSADSSFKPEALDSSDYLIRYQTYTSPVMTGRIICGMAKRKVDLQVSVLNRPVLYTMVLIILMSIVLFYFLATGLSRPVSLAIKNAHLLGQNRFDDFIYSKKSRTDEIGLLEEALLSLRASLMEQRRANELLINNLEDEVAKRTSSLNSAVKSLNEAQIIARLAAFSWVPSRAEWSVSQSINGILGFEENQLISFETFSQMPEESFRNQFEELFISRKEASIEAAIRFNDKEGEIKWLNIICLYNEKDGGYFSGTIQDITEQKTAEEELERLSLLATNTTNLVLFTDKYKRITWVNDSLVNLTGYSREELYGKTPRIFQSEKTRVHDLDRINDALNQVKPVKAEVLNRGKFGNEYWLELYIQPLFDINGEHTGFMAIEIDITERKITEERLKKYVRDIEEKQAIINSINSNLEQLVNDKTRDLEDSMVRLRSSQDELVRREKMATLGMLAAGIAHEVNTPLGAIKASSENLHYLLEERVLGQMPQLSHFELNLMFDIYMCIPSDSRLTPRQERAAAAEISNVLIEKYPAANLAWLGRTFASLGFENIEFLPRTFFELEDGRKKVLLDMVSALSGLNISLSTIETAIGRASKIIRALNVYSHGAESAPHAPFGLRDSINAVADLLSNKMKQGSVFVNQIDPEIMVLGQEDELSQVWTNLMNNALQASGNKCTIKVYTTKADNDMLQVHVENDGPPIPPDIVDRIFDEFFTTKKRGEGTGLGLSIVSKIIERHNGNITCRSETGSTVFTVTLPVAKAEK